MYFLIRDLLVAICVLYLVRAILRSLLPFLFQSVINKAQQGQQQQKQNYRSKEKPTDRVKVDFVPQGKKNTVPDSEGEFVDYEEIK